MSNVTIKDFHVGESAWSIEHFGNTKKIVEGKVVKVGRKYVTMDGFGRNMPSFPEVGSILQTMLPVDTLPACFLQNRLHRNLSRKKS